MARLGINIEKVAMLRNASKQSDADPVTAAMYAEIGGCDGIVCPLSETLDPVTERDIRLLKQMYKTHFNIQVPLIEKLMNMAMSVSPDMITILPNSKPGSKMGAGLEVMGLGNQLIKPIKEGRAQDVMICLSIEPEIHQVKAAAKIGADYVEMHMGRYVQAEDLHERMDQLENIRSVALAASKLGLGVAVGGGLNFQTVSAIAAIDQIEEINIGQAVISRALWVGMEAAVRDMSGLVR